ncbi:MAG: sigma-70 family RNA polymerase sigma factor [Acidobacteriota bacterium]
MALDTTETMDAGGSQPAVPEEKLSDHALIEATRRGDETAFAEVISRYRGPITNYLYRFIGDYEEAVDLSQETFVRLYFAIDRYHTEYAFSTYLYRIATNLAISELRRRKRRRLLSLTGLFQNEIDEGIDFEPPDQRSLPDADLVVSERNRQIEKAIAALPDKYRAPIVLREIEERSYDEIAQILGLGLGTTKSRISRARGLLKEKLTKYL